MQLRKLYFADGIIFRLNKIIIPRKLRCTVIKAAHILGHLEMTKTKQILRQNVWFPKINKQVELVVGQSYECQVTTRHHNKEPLKIPEKPWQTVSADFRGPYPDGHYNLVVIDKRTMYPEIDVIYSTAAKPTKVKLEGYSLRTRHLNS